jgi:hypothetical protein
MKLPPRTSRALQLLLEAFEYSQNLNRSIWDFALEIAVLRGGGLNNNDFRWLVYKGYLLHAAEADFLDRDAPSADTGRLALSEHSCFVLTPEGVCFAQTYLAQQTEQPSSDATGSPSVASPTF